MDIEECLRTLSANAQAADNDLVWPENFLERPQRCLVAS